MFAELHCHTDYGSNARLIDTINKIEPTIDHAVSIGLQGLAITDHAALCSHIKALLHLRKVHEHHPEFQLILGDEIYLCHDTAPWTGEDGKTRYSIESRDFHHFILLAKDAVGHTQLRELSSISWGRCYTYKGVERVPTFYSDIEQIVGQNPGHLIASTACLGGELDKLLLSGDTAGADAFVVWCQSMFGAENFFIELQPGLSEEQVRLNQLAVAYAKARHLRWIVTNDVHYLTADKRKLHEVFLNSHEEEREMSDFYESTYFKTEQEMLERMSYLPEADVRQGFQNTMVILELCKDAGEYDLFHPTEVPQRPLPPFTVRGTLDIDWERYPFIHRFTYSPEPQDRWLVKQLEDGAVRVGMPSDDQHLARIEYELAQMAGISEHLHQPVSAYYNLTQLLVDIMWQCSIVGVGRGSVGGWYIAYLLGVTQLDPIQWGMVPWRHLHASRPDLPDIDIDTAGSQREAVFQAVRDFFGEEHCLRTITFRSETTKAAIHTACRGLGIDSDTADELSNLVPITRGAVWTLSQCEHGTADNGFRPVTELISRMKSYPNLLETVREIEGLISGRGQHASSVYLFNDRYTAHNARMRTPQGVDCTCWEMSDSDLCSALKEDFLTIEALDKIQCCMNELVADGRMEDKGSLRATYDAYLAPGRLDYTSPEMWRMAADGEITDLFQMDTEVGREAIREVRPRTLKELSLTNSVMRLMGNEDGSPIDRFVDFKDRVQAWDEEVQQFHLTAQERETIHRVLGENHYCSIEQEDMMRLVMEKDVAGFTMKEANLIRKAVAKKKPALVEQSKNLFYEKGKAQGTRKEFLDYVWLKHITPQLG